MIIGTNLAEHVWLFDLKHFGYPCSTNNDNHSIRWQTWPPIPSNGIFYSIVAFSCLLHLRLVLWPIFSFSVCGVGVCSYSNCHAQRLNELIAFSTHIVPINSLETMHRMQEVPTLGSETNAWPNKKQINQLKWEITFCWFIFKADEMAILATVHARLAQTNISRNNQENKPY